MTYNIICSENYWSFKNSIEVLITHHSLMAVKPLLWLVTTLLQILH